ncbi:MAG: hypothetical protein U9Q27_01560 [Patescibacteria group bacterium]|nr:hypothetical protein [Patescibacteria group bacterium]
MDAILIILIILVTIYKIGYFIGYHRGIKICSIKTFNMGYFKGKKTIENEILKLSKENDEEIINRIKNFNKNYKKL